MTKSTSRFKTPWPKLAAWAAIPMLLVAFAGRADGVVVFKKGESEPLMGFLVRETPQEIELETVAPDGARRRVVLERAEIEDILQSVEPERLTELRPAAPRDYRNYAEELAVKKRDPEARETAIRLYLIAAWLQPEELGKGSLLGMIALARGETEERAFRGMAFLLDPEHDRRLLAPPGPLAGGTGTANDAARRKLLAGLSQFRRGNAIGALAMLRDDDVQPLLAEFRGLLSLGELEDAARRPAISDEVLAGILAIELSLRHGAPRAAGGKAAASWGQGVVRHGDAPLPVMTLETITEFDPAHCVYEDGRWLRPEGLIR